MLSIPNKFLAPIFLTLLFCIGIAHASIDMSYTDVNYPEYNTSDEPGDLWEELGSNIQLNNYCDNPQVKTQINWYVSHHNYLYRIADNAKPYLYYIYSQVNKRSMPPLITLMPFNESAYNPFAYSNQGAAGLWQLMPGTASGYGVKQDWWYDGRRDIYASTNSALNYLQYLGNFFDNNWLLAIAAYDSGEGTVQNALRHNQRLGLNTDFWSLPLPKETKIYVPRLLALACIVSSPDDYNVKLPQVADAPYLAKVDIGSQIDLQHAATLAHMSLKELYNLNPGYNRWATDPNGPYEIILPIDKVALFKKNLAAIPKDQRVSWANHLVQSGDSLSTIAHDYKTSVDLLKQVNKLKNDDITIGQLLFIPKNASHLNPIVLKAEQKYLNQEQKLPGPQRIVHTVRKGETVWSIQKQYNVTMREIQFWNQLGPKTYIQPGQKLILWSKVPTHHASVSSSKLRSYAVKPGDSIWSIAKTAQLSVKDIEKWNNLKHNQVLHIGQEILIR